MADNGPLDPAKHTDEPDGICKCACCLSMNKVLYWHHMALHAPTSADETEALKLAVRWFDHADMMAAVASMRERMPFEPTNGLPRSGPRH